MSNFEVPSPILSSPYEEPKEHWWILEGQPAERRPGRRPALYFYREPVKDADQRGGLHFDGVGAHPLTPSVVGYEQ